MNASTYEGEPPPSPGEWAVGHEFRNLCGFLVHLLCDIDPHSEFAHMVRDLEAIESPGKNAPA